MLEAPPVNDLENQVVAPSFAPQITDPRIEVQTYNAPNAPELPNTLPRPKIKVNIRMPTPIEALPRNIIIHK